MQVLTGQQAQDLQLVDIHGDAVRLSSLCKENPVMLFFHRPLGCIFAQQAFKRLDCSVGQLEAHGVRIVSIVPTTAANACSFCTDGDFWHTCLADPKLVGYHAYGVPTASPVQMFGPKPIACAFQAMKRGYRVSGKQIGHAFVIPAAIIVDSNGIIQAVRYSKHVGDIPSVSELMLMAVDAKK